MSTQCIESVLSAPVAAPRGDLVLRATAAIGAAARNLWNILSAVGEARARRELLTLARHSETTRPELAASLRAAARHGWAQ